MLGHARAHRFSARPALPSAPSPPARSPTARGRTARLLRRLYRGADARSRVVIGRQLAVHIFIDEGGTFIPALAALLESASRREPFVMVEDARFNYKYFNRSFAMKKEISSPGCPPEVIEGHDIRKMMTERMAFVDSRSETLIQAVDILGSFLRRLLASEITSDDVSRALGRLQIYTQRKSNHPQSLRVLTLSDQTGGQSDLFNTDLFNTLRVMTRAARKMLKPKRTRRRPGLPTSRGSLFGRVRSG